VPVLADDVTIRGTISGLQAICAEHPEFRASSIDFYNPETAVPFEREFYERTQSLHNQRRAIEILLDMRKSASAADVICIDNILNTWPG
jgi:hypothetical protein